MPMNANAASMTSRTTPEAGSSRQLACTGSGASSLSQRNTLSGNRAASGSAMVQLVEGGFGIATLPRAAVERLAERLPLKPLATDVPLTPLPVHLSWRADPAGGVPAELVDAVLSFAGGARSTARAKAADNRTGTAARRRPRPSS